ncbi:hypothetical protein DICPUDRAFT_158954 [Dictyostelium purpureum]|uniref:PH domain-containing protein n=1 Tax=Dictyostelium purpureum TaxID=5786 RepID=F1A2X1_DICPU|nr:uncharacterized protein DICPUDRAFT_158954 [Dictyostelium purpureum]EGC29462.1 hypothetical protein DICPUDRAFT_158954 [Dictyostelium purpureum]|eukprot:XP_003294016.1 hypothetical protein DICPUDRAFT_158954 [Dictyostelium purpureum]
MEPPLKKILKVFDEDGLYKTMAIEPSSTAGEICEKFAKKLFLNDSEIVQFSLFIFEGGVRHQLKVTDFPFDFLVKYEKKDFKFYFLNPNGEFISFDKEKQKNNSISSGPPKKELPMPNTGSSSSSSSTAPPPRSSKGMSGWLLRKRPGRYDKIWAVSKGDKSLRLYENEDTDSEPLYDLSLENSIVELKQDLHLVLTLGNSERYTFTSESESEIVSWAHELQATMNYQAGQSKPIIKNSSPMGGMLMGMGMGMGGFVPSSRDLNVKLQNKAENSTTQLSTLVGWVNHILSGKGLKCSDDEVLSAFSDGILFVNLIDDLFGQKITYRKGKSVYEMQYNIDRCLEVLKEKCKCDYGKIMSSDVTECKVAKIIVRILWSMFVSFVTNGEKEYAVKDKLLGWASNLVIEYTNKSIIVDSPAALRNPLVFAAIIAKLNPSVIDYQSIASKKSKEDQAQIIINIASDQFSIPKVVDASFWSDDKVDEKSFLIYLSMFYYYLSNQDQEKSEIIKSSINQREPCEPESTMREKQLKAIKEKQQQEEQQQQEPPKPVSQPLKKATGKPLPQPRKLPPTAKPAATPQPVSETPASTATSNTITINGVSINKPKPPAQTFKKPAPVPLKPKPTARPPSAFVKPKEDEQEKLKQQEQERLEQERLEQERLEQEQQEQERLEQEQQEQERLEQERLEEERLEEERLEEERLEEERLEEERLEEERLEQERLEQERLEQERKEKEKQEKIKQQEKERQEKIKQQEKEKEEKERKLKEQTKKEETANDIFESDAFKLLDEIVVGCDKYTSTSSPSNSQISFSNSYENSSFVNNDEVEQFTKSFEQLQNEEERYNSFLRPAPAQQAPSRLSNKDINLNFDPSVVDELDSIIGNLPDTTGSSDFKARSPDSTSSSAKEVTPNEVSEDAAPKSPTVTSTKVRKPLPTLTKEQEQARQSVAIKSQDIQQIETKEPEQTTTSNTANKEDQTLSPRNTQGRVVVRICLEGFGDVLFCSFAIGYDTVCGKVRDMVIKKMKVQQAEEHEYSLHIVRDGLERVLDDDEILLEAEDKIDRFVFKKNEFDRRLLISNHRPPK